MSHRLARQLGGCVLGGLVLVSGRAFAQSGDVLEEKGEDEAASTRDDNDDGGWRSDDDTGAGSSESGFHFGLRLAYGLPLGYAVKSQQQTTGGAADKKMSDYVDGQIPIWVDLGWQFSSNFMLGAYFSYGFVLLDSKARNACDQRKVDCSASDMRLGIQAQYSFSPHRSVDPWVGVGIGYEWFTQKEKDAKATLEGWELPMLQAGLDFGGDSGGSTFGPFVAFTFATYTKYRNDRSSGNVSELGDTAMHDWLFLGIRGVAK
jgi:hypothetical protein